MRALSLFLILTLLLGTTEATEPNNGQQKTNTDKKPADQRSFVVIENVSKPPEERDKQSIEKEKFDGQIAEYTKELAKYTFGLFIVTGILAGAAIWQIRLLIKAEGVANTTAQAANRSANVARDTLIATNRPWLMIARVHPDKDFIEESGMTGIGVQVSVKNFGNSPAVNIKIHVRPVIAFDNDDKKFAEFVDEEFGPDAEFWLERGNGETLFQQCSFMRSQKGLREIADFDPEKTKIMLLVGVSYRFPFIDGKPGYAANLYEVVRLARMEPPTAQTHPVSQQRLELKELRSHAS